MSRRRWSAEERKADLVRHAAALFLERGIEAVAVSDIVARAGVAQGTFYYHFSSKDAVLEAAIGQILDEMIGQTEAVVRRESDPCRRLRCLMEELIGQAVRRDHLHAELHRPELAVIHDRLAERMRGWIIPLFEELVADGTRLGQFRVEHPREAVEAIVACLAAFVHHPDIKRDAGRRTRMIATLNRLTDGLLSPCSNCLKLDCPPLPCLETRI